jgi:cytochrome c553
MPALAEEIAMFVRRFLLEGAKDTSGGDLVGAVSELVARGVKREIGEITLRNRNRNLKREQFIQEADFAPSGVVRIARLKREGAGCIKPARLLPSALASAAIAAFLALGPSPHAAADLKRAQEIVEGKCFICHGIDGESSSPIFPRLAGQNAQYVARQLADYASGKRKSTQMQPMVEGLTTLDFEVLGRFYESRPVHQHAIEDPELALVGRFIYARGNPFTGVPACASCHGARGQGTAQLPRLAGQHAAYTERQLRQFNQRERSNDNAVMHNIARQLTELETKAVASYISGLK